MTSAWSRPPWGWLRGVSLLALAGLVAGCAVEASGRGELGTEAPEYRAVTLDGDPFQLADHRGEVVLLNIWATWCPPCRTEMPHLQTLQEQFGEDGLRVVGVSIDSEGAESAVRRFLEELGVTFMVVRDPSDRVSGTFGAYGVPLTLLIDREGIVQWRHLGPVTATNPVLLSAIHHAL